MNTMFSIRYKFLIVLSSLLLICIISYLSIALYTFKRDKTELVFDLNKSVVSTRVSEIDSYIDTIQDKLELLAITANPLSRQKVNIDRVFENDGDIVYAVALQASSNIPYSTYTQTKFLETYNLQKQVFTEISNLPVIEILEKGVYLWPIYSLSHPTLIAIGKAVVHENSKGQVKDQSVVISFIQAKRFLPEKGLLKLNDIFIADHQGQVIAHSKLKTQDELKSFHSQLIPLSQKSVVRTEVLTYMDNDESRMGSYAKSTSGLITVYSTISEDTAFAALSSFLRRSFLFAGIISTVALIAAILFSRTLTQPLHTLVEGMQKVSNGELQTRIIVKSNDETSILAHSFNQMISELQDSRHQLEEINKDLEEKVKDRTQKLEEQHRLIKETQDALIQTTRLATVGEIAARAAHEVLNPLTSMMTRLHIVQKRYLRYRDPEMLLFSDILNAWMSDYKAGGFQHIINSWSKKSDLNPNQNLFEEDMENLMSIQKNQELKSNQLLEDSDFLLGETQRISKIVQSMRSLSQVRGNREPHNLSALIQDSLKVMADHIHEAKIKLVTQIHSDNDLLNVDRDEFIQCTTNLIRNSIQSLVKSRDQNNRLLRISTFISDGKIHIDFYDNGSGIAQDHQQQLFVTQFSTKNREEGTGLGLSISRRFIRAVDGDLFLVSSDSEKGTIFRLTLPVYSETKGAVA